MDNKREHNILLRRCLNERETTQLDILARMFAENGFLDKSMFQPDGLARTLASKLAVFLNDYYGNLDIEKDTKNESRFPVI